MNIEEQSDLGLNHLFKPVCPKLGILVLHVFLVLSSDDSYVCFTSNRCLYDWIR